MPYRLVQQKSDRGSLKDIQKRNNDILEEDLNLPPTSGELRIKSLYEHALVTRNQALIDSLGLIVMDGSPNNPVDLLQHKEYVKGLSEKLKPEVAQAKEEIENLIATDLQGPAEMRITAYKQITARNMILSEDSMIIKNASDDSVRSRKRSFWRTE